MSVVGPRALLHASVVAAIGCGSGSGANAGGTTGEESTSEASSSSSTSDGSGSTEGSSSETTLEESSSGGSTGDPIDEDPPDGDPLPPADLFEWQWIDIDGSTCRDGSPAGFAYRYGASNDLVVFFAPGGACFNGASCFFNEAAIARPFAPYIGGIFEDRPGNPVHDWNAVLIPYCTGDIHVGAQEGGADFLGGEEQRFVGWLNHGLFLARIHPTFAGVDRLFLTGMSAGGFGSGSNFERYVERFEMPDAIMLDDSGPPMSDAYLPACLQAHWRESWRISDTFLASCGSACNGQPDGGGIVNVVSYLSDALPDATMGFVSTLGDYNIRQFYGYGNDDCADLYAISPPEYPPERYAEGLFDLRDNHANGPQWGTYFIDGTEHGILLSERMYTTEVGGVLFTDWLAAMIDGAPTHVAP